MEVDDMSEYGTLTDYATGEPLRPATREEWAISRDPAAGTGTFTVDRDLEICAADADEASYGPKRIVFVDGGGEESADPPPRWEPTYHGLPVE
jgi:hypothetical protein